MGEKDYSAADGGMPRNAMLLPSNSPAPLTKISDKTPHKVAIKPLPIGLIPGAMRNMGWTVSAALMERWFASEPWHMPDAEKVADSHATSLMTPARVDDHIVTISWALKYRRFVDALDYLGGRWNVPAAAYLIVDNLFKKGWDGSADFSLGYSSVNARELDSEASINYAKVGKLTDSLDDMYGALGKSTLKMAVIGYVRVDPSSGRRVFHVDGTAFYIKDHYDFNGVQYLGLWTETGILGKAATVIDTALSGFTSPGLIYHWKGGGVGHVYNHHFRDYRDTQKKGGDFFIFSDVQWSTTTGHVDLESAIQQWQLLASRKSP